MAGRSRHCLLSTSPQLAAYAGLVGSDTLRHTLCCPSAVVLPAVLAASVLQVGRQGQHAAAGAQGHIQQGPAGACQ